MELGVATDQPGVMALTRTWPQGEGTLTLLPFAACQTRHIRLNKTSNMV